MILAARRVMPLPLLPRADLDRNGRAVDDLAQAAVLALDEGAFLDGGAFGGRAGRGAISSSSSSSVGRPASVTTPAGRRARPGRAVPRWASRGSAGRQV